MGKIIPKILIDKIVIPIVKNTNFKFKYLFIFIIAQNNWYY